jgi:hypothetical protein
VTLRASGLPIKTVLAHREVCRFKRHFDDVASAS